MRKPVFDSNWPSSWKLSYEYDLMEVFGVQKHPGYVYGYQNRKNALIGAITESLPTGSKILDVAAGSGNFSLILAEKGYQMVWNDLRSDLADYVKLKQETGSLEYLPGNVFDLTETQFDGVIISEIIEHVAHPDVFLTKIASLIKPGGYVFLSTPLGSYFLNRLPKFSTFSNPEIFEKEQFKPNADGHIFLLHTYEIEKLAHQARLSLKRMEYNNNPLTMGHIGLHQLLRFLPSGFISSIEGLTKRLPAYVTKKLHCNVIAVLQKVN